MRLFLFICAFALSSFSFSQEIDQDLKNRLKHVLLRDQGFRELWGGPISNERKQVLLKELSLTEKDFLDNERSLFQKNDSLNLVEIEKIINHYGYPGKSMVGEPENETAWFVIQHSSKIEKYFPLIKRAGEEGELKMSKVAMMEDRMLMYKGETQIYGTQAKGIFKVKNPSKQEDIFYIIWPVRNPEKVNELRKTMGLQSTIEEYAQNLGIEY